MKAGNTITQVEVAKKLNISQKTISRVLNKDPMVKGETREMVLGELARIGYAPNLNARNLVTGRQNAIGILMPGEYTLQSIYFTEALSGIMHETKKSGKELLFHSVSEGKETIQDFNVFLHRVDALLIFNIGSERETVPKLLKTIIKSSKPFILIESRPDKKYPFATIDNHLGGYLAGNHLLRLGHRKLCVISEKNASLWEYDQRRDGFLASAEEKGISNRDVCILDAEERNNLVPIVEKILSMKPGKRPTAFFLMNDHMARVLTVEFEKRGYAVPRDFSIIGFNDIKRETELMHPFLTTVRQPFRELGMEAVRALVEEKAGGSIRLTVEPELIIRETCAAAVSEQKGTA